MNEASRPAPNCGAGRLLDALSRRVPARQHQVVACDHLEIPSAGLPIPGENCPDVFWSVALPSFRMIHASSAAERVFGRSEAALLLEPLSWTGLVHPADVERFSDCVDDVLTRDQCEVEYRIVRPDGDLRWVRSRMWAVRQADGRAFRLEGITADITGHKDGAGMHPTGQNLRALIDHAADAIFIYGIDRRIVDVNRHACESLGYSRDELLSFTLADIEVGVQPAELYAVRRRLSLGESVTIRGRHRRKNGTEFPVEVRVGSLKDAGGELMIALARDITHQRRSEERQDAFLHLGQRLNTATSAEEAARIILEVADKLFGWHACWLDLIDPDTGVCRSVVLMDLVDDIRTCVAAPESPQSGSAYGRTALEYGPLLILNDPDTLNRAWGEEDIPFGDLTRRSASLMVVPIRHGEKSIGVLSIQSYDFDAYTSEDLEILQALADYCAGALERTRGDETREQLEMQLRQAQKMDAVGRLAGGIAHDFNNMLAVINGYSTLILETSDLPELLRERLGQVARAGERAAGLTKQLLAFSRSQAVKPQAIALTDTVQQLRKMLDRLLGEDLTLEVETATTHGPIWADPGQVEQVVLNLVLNARDAMPSGGTMRLEVDEHESLLPAMSLFGPIPPGKYVRLAVSDNGIGISPDVMPHIFEPFFTTKPQGKGTGLGLSTVYGIIRRCDGYLDVRSRMGDGSTFVLYFPRRREPEVSTTSTIPVKASLGRGERVLLVEDEQLVRVLTRTVLSESGYTVTDVGSPEEALEACGDGPCPFDLLMTDVVMPGMSGVELAARLVRDRPGLRVLLMSGYTEDMMMKHGVASADWILLSKPFTRIELLEKVREALAVESC